MSFVAIKKELVQRISANVTTLQDVYGYERVNPSGFPYGTIVRSHNESDFNTNRENLRVYAFRFVVWEQMGQLPPNDPGSDNAKERAEGIIDEVVDQVIDYFELTTNISLGGLVTWVEAIPSTGVYLQGPGGWYRGAEVIIRCHKLVAVT